MTEDLSFTIKNKRQSKSVNRRLSEWCKGTLQKALEEISYRRQSSVTVVNAAYTSQVDSRFDVLLGTRKGDQFFTFDGEVLQADGNAARNIETRLDDTNIIAVNQEWKCPVCGENLFNGEQIETHHIVPVKDGGEDSTDNLVHLHKACHKQVHSKIQVKGLK